MIAAQETRQIHEVTFDSIQFNYKTSRTEHLIHKNHDVKIEWECGGKKWRLKGCKLNSKVAPIIDITNG